MSDNKDILRQHHTSIPEHIIYYYIKKFFSGTINRYKPDWLKPMELDIFIPSLNIGIEYDGCRFHTEEKREPDERKNKLLADNNIKLIRIREEGCANIDMLNHHLIECKYKEGYEYLNDIILQIIKYIYNTNNISFDINEIDIDVKRDYENIIKLLDNTIMENSLGFKYPELLKEWHPTKNKKKNPYIISYGSHAKVWWTCPNGHVYPSSVLSRTTGKGCSICSGNTVSISNCLATLRPDLANEWHPTKNGNFTPYEVTCGSDKKVWWLCSEGHAWESNIDNRNRGKGCKKCYQNKRQKKKEENINRVKELKESGLSNSEISKETGLSLKYVKILLIA